MTAGFVEEKGSEVSRESVLAYADLGDDSSTLLTRTVKHLFPSVSTRRRKDGMYPLSQIYIKYTVYLNILFVVVVISAWYVFHSTQYLLCH